MTATIAKWGNCSAVRLPARLLKLMDMTVGDQVQINLSQDNRKLIIEPVKPSLSELLSQITTTNRHNEQFSDIKGNELL